MFPADDVLIARGKYSTLRKLKKEQLERVQAICNMLVTEAQAALRECQAKTQGEPQHIVTLANCVENLSSARDRIVTLNVGMAELEQDAWPK